MDSEAAVPALIKALGDDGNSLWDNIGFHDDGKLMTVATVVVFEAYHPVRLAAQETLESLTGKSFGCVWSSPVPSDKWKKVQDLAPSADWRKVQERWSEWWRSYHKENPQIIPIVVPHVPAPPPTDKPSTQDK